ncbi:MAG: hypothetical protein IKN07_01800 [Lachnospiraceae bacterium]|nr:hypothetical protein [Lachnospiraceae bacterium]MBR3734586.1 hypothetical protein [Lachnospiraceae bacterium]
MIIPDSVLNQLQRKPTDNSKIYVAEDMFDDLESKTEQTYKNYHMSILANDLELYYKGVLEASGLNVAESLMKESHDLYRLHSEISTRIQPLDVCNSRSEEHALKQFLRDISALYIDARYDYAQTSYDDFCKCRKYLEIQRDKCMSLLDPSRAWDKPKPVMEKNNLPVKPYEPSADAIKDLI